MRRLRLLAVGHRLPRRDVRLRHLGDAQVHLLRSVIRETTSLAHKHSLLHPHCAFVCSVQTSFHVANPHTTSAAFEEFPQNLSTSVCTRQTNNSSGANFASSAMVVLFPLATLAILPKDVSRMTHSFKSSVYATEERQQQSRNVSFGQKGSHHNCVSSEGPRTVKSKRLTARASPRSVCLLPVSADPLGALRAVPPPLQLHLVLKMGNNFMLTERDIVLQHAGGVEMVPFNNLFRINRHD